MASLIKSFTAMTRHDFASAMKTMSKYFTNKDVYFHFSFYRLPMFPDKAIILPDDELCQEIWPVVKDFFKRATGE